MADRVQFEVKVVRTLQEMEQLREVWSSMQWNPESDIDFVSFIISVRPEIIRPYVMVVYKNGQPVSLLAGRLEHGHLDVKIGYKVLWRLNIRRIAIFYGGFMGEATTEISKIVVQQLLRSLRDEKADLFVWTGIRPDTDLKTLLNRIPNPLCRDYLSRPIRHWRMSLPGSLDEILENRMNKKHRYWAKRTMRLLEKDFSGQVRYSCLSTPAEVQRLFEDSIQIAKKTYQWGLAVGFQDNEEQRKRLELEAKRGWLRGYVLYLNDKPVAFWICLVYKDTVYLASTGYDPIYRKYEVGTALFLRMVGEQCANNAKFVDFGLGSAFYKERFGDEEFEETAVCVFNFGIRGIFLNGLKLLTGGPTELVRWTLKRLSLEQKLKKLWRSHLTPPPGIKDLDEAKESAGSK